MKYKIELDNGLKIILNEEQIMKVHQYFEKQCLLEYVGNNNTDWSDEKIEFVTERAFDILKEFDNSDNEHYAIDSAVEEWEVFKHGKKIRN